MHPNNQLSVNRSEDRKGKKDIKQTWIRNVLKGSVSPSTWASDSAFVACSMLRNNLVKAVVHSTRWSHKDRESSKFFCEGKSHLASLAVQCTTITGCLGPALAVSFLHNVFTPTFNPLKAQGALIDGGNTTSECVIDQILLVKLNMRTQRLHVTAWRPQAKRLGYDFS